jgi:hypothetical protein
MPSLSVFLASHHHVLAYLTQALRSRVRLVILIALFAPLEHFFSVRPAKLFQKDSLVNVGWYFINILAPIFLLEPPATLLAWAVHACLPASFTGAAAGLPLWALIIVAMIVGEIGFYWRRLATTPSPPWSPYRRASGACGLLRHRMILTPSPIGVSLA